MILLKLNSRHGSLNTRNASNFMNTFIQDRVAAARAGDNANVIAKMASGWLVISDMQFARGWCILLADPVVGDLHELPPAARSIFLNDMAAAGEALLRATGAERMNYSILGNSAPALHAHLHPRFGDEPPANRAQPVWNYDKALLNSRPFDPERDAPLMRRIRELLGNAAIG